MKFLVLGAGKMGQVACYDLLRQKKTTAVVAADNEPRHLQSLQKRFPDPRLTTVEFDAGDTERIIELMRPADACIGAVHYRFNVQLTKAAITARTHFCDLGGNNDIVRAQLALDTEAQRAGISAIPDCGLAPGMASLLVAWGLEKWLWVDTVKIRVGGLPQNPQPPLGYSLFFAVDGLINEYVEPVRVLRDGKIEIIEPLTELETLEFPQPYGTMEAFATSGGSSTLPETFGQRLKDLDYKTIRYPGHMAIVAALYRLGFFSSEEISVSSGRITPHEVSARLLADNLPHEQKDVTLVRICFSGNDSGQQRTHNLTIIDHYDEKLGITSMARMTAFPAAIISLMQAGGQIKKTGVFPQERGVPPQPFIDQLQRRNIHIAGIE